MVTWQNPRPDAFRQAAPTANRQGGQAGSTPDGHSRTEPTVISYAVNLVSGKVRRGQSLSYDSGVMSTSKLRAARLGTKLENRKCRSTQPSTRTLNKGHDASITSTPLKSKAAKFNTHTLRKLQAAVDNDPEINLITQMPLDYSIRLVEFQGECREESKEIIEKSETTKRREGDIRDCLRPSDPVDITYKPSTTLATVWPQMDNDQKASIRDQLGAIMSNLRSIPYTDGSALGGVVGEGCKDIRRHLRKSEKPIRSLVEFEEFLFSSPHPGGQVFTELLRQLLPDSTHGDEDCFHAR
ncbi:hypothetical protein CISG_07652 [Coccidioides immitis RMSCC 3703]|uniref:Uncharacterized protein n=1 Tax=Coccidioides immitis RMSCC 3703 TaxID=454286 RepID=A0A0J8R3B6_COCIT|nr:hypothetical protein CISG_07652 [Coccidioides immitis RMSCC 3703]